MTGPIREGSVEETPYAGAEVTGRKDGGPTHALYTLVIVYVSGIKILRLLLGGDPVILNYKSGVSATLSCKSCTNDHLGNRWAKGASRLVCIPRGNNAQRPTLHPQWLTK